VYRIEDDLELRVVFPFDNFELVCQILVRCRYLPQPHEVGRTATRYGYLLRALVPIDRQCGSFAFFKIKVTSNFVFR
jgi:hypothetical protein